MARFVLLHHQLPPAHPRASHWDLMIEAGDQLETWALDQLPQPGRAVRATRLANHRKWYLNYEGPVSRERGQVRQVDAGDFNVLTRDDNQLVLRMSGELLTGVVTLRQMAEDEWQVVVSEADK